MTRQEQTGKRNLDFSKWVRINLPDSYEGFLVSDLDFVLMDEATKKFALVEVKMYGGPKKKVHWQKRMFNRLDKWLKIGVLSDPEWIYLGFYWVVVSNTAPNNSRRILLNGEEVTEEELIEKLSF